MSLPLRKRSILIAVLPWNTDTVVVKSCLSKGFPPENAPEGLLKAAKAVEGLAARFPGIEALLQAEEGPTEPLPQAEGQPTELRLFSGDRDRGRDVFKAAMALLTVYRVIDVCSWVRGAASEKVPLIPRLETIYAPRKQPWSKMQDWTALLEEARGDLGLVGAQDAPDPGALSAAHRISSLFRRRDRAQASINLEVAATHLRYICQGNADVPDKTDDLLGILTGSSPLQGIDLVKYLEEMKGTTQRFRLPLHIALFITPLFLLAPKTIHDRDWDRKSIILAFKAFGTRPESVRRVEMSLWRVLFRVADGEDLALAIHDLFNDVPPNLFKDLPASEKGWFRAERGDDTWNSPGAFDVRLEGQPPQGWTHFVPKTPAAEMLGKRKGYDGRGDGVQARKKIHQSKRGGEEGGGEDEKEEEEEEEEGEEEEEEGEGGKGPVVKDPGTGAGMGDGAVGGVGVGSGAGVGVNGVGGAEPKGGARGGSAERSGGSELDAGVGSGGRGGGDNNEGDGGNQLKENDALRGSSGDKGGGGDGESGMSGENSGASRGHDSGSQSFKGPRRVSSRISANHPYSKPARPATQESTRKSTHARASTRPPMPRKSGKAKAAASSNPPAKPSIEDGDAIFRPIDLTLEQPTLVHLTAPKKYLGRAYTVFGPLGERFEIEPASHSEVELDQFLKILDAVVDGYVDGQPRHISQPKSSIFAIRSNEEFNQLPGKAISIWIPFVSYVFCQGLEPSKANQSIDPGKGGNYNCRNVEGTLFQVHESVSKLGDEAKILNVLDCPMGDSVTPRRNSFTSDLWARWATKELHDCGSHLPLPADDIRWGLAATSGATHWFHIDSDGFGTFIDVQTGGKLWIVARPKPGESNADFARIDLLHSSGLIFRNPTRINGTWKPRMLRYSLRIMRPNTPHAVYTHGHAICHGGHFYATSCLQDTLYSLIHSFVAGSVVTNTEHRASRQILRRMVQFYHHVHTNELASSIPVAEGYQDHMLSLDTSSGVLDLFSICILTEASNILSLETYEDGMSLEEMRSCVEARQRSRDLISWFFSKYELVRSGVVLDGYKEVYWRFLARVLLGLVKYMVLVRGDATVEGCTWSAVMDEVDKCFRGVKEYLSAAFYWEGKEINSLAWPSDVDYAFEVRPLTTPNEWKRRFFYWFPAPQIAQASTGVPNGLTSGDKRYQRQ
ncbi:hypothetical protein BD779DRAFT_1676763 [Infundibulicybe gibba]|nr:hypothetical protein BD779DRAFT_1676763 [Infundibulicybe gibba]